MDDFSLKNGVRIGGAVISVWVIALVAVLLCGIGGMALDTLINTHITQPLQRQNKNHDADWCIGQTQDLVQTYQDFQAAQQRVPIDAQALKQYEAQNGDPHGYSYTQQQEYNHLELVVTGDYQAETRLAAHYNGLMINPDVQACAPFPSTLPASLTPDQPQQ